MDATGWTAVAAIAASVTAVLYICTVIYAVKQVGEARKLRESQARPFVIVDVEPGFLLYLVIANIGTTLARNVKIAFTPALASTVAQPWEVDEAPLLRDGVAMLAPGRQHRIFFDSFAARVDRGDLPMEYGCTVTYEDDEGHRFTDNYPLDLRAILHTSPAEKGLPEVVKELEKIAKEMHKWTDGIRGLLVHTRDKEGMERRHREAFEERRRQAEGGAAD